MEFRDVPEFFEVRFFFSVFVSFSTLRLTPGFPSQVELGECLTARTETLGTARPVNEEVAQLSHSIQRHLEN